jgi:hypothetical protein
LTGIHYVIIPNLSSGEERRAEEERRFENPRNLPVSFGQRPLPSGICPGLEEGCQ